MNFKFPEWVEVLVFVNVHGRNYFRWKKFKKTFDKFIKIWVKILKRLKILIICTHFTSYSVAKIKIIKKIAKFE